MKTLTISFLAFFWVASSYAQNLNPKEYAVLPREGIANEKTAKRKDGTYSLGAFNSPKNVLFTPDGEYLYLLNVSEKWDGKLVIYNVKEKKIEKIFPLAKIGLFYDQNFTYNAANMYQIAVMVNKSEIIILPDWRTEPENAFTKKASASSKRIVVNARTESSKFNFSTDGKLLYVIESESNALKIADLATGKVAKQALPKGKFLYLKEESSPFIGKDEALILSEEDKKTSMRIAEIYDIPNDKIVRSYEISGIIGHPRTYPYNPHLLYHQYDGHILNLKTGVVVDAKSIKKAYSEKNTFSDLLLIPERGYMLNHTYYKSVKSTSNINRGTMTTESRETKHALLFLDKNGKRVNCSFPSVNAEMPWTAIGYYQISPNYKYVLFCHEDLENDAKSSWIIATL